ncbi:ACP S-malonyltransferase [Bacillus sp. AGMB 02131]|uniref:Malonyl CoA-acyl carrier protein transacylase n=1 Tax=Peribacillus faecalis TaxID=2772559 RepID=A0A927H9R1_9BACI|nr:ACP S-malonyltransferase [Peribacillus faecalis]MBD3106762.1 ACP S-malonyltransferase [Peribacillus faecalis]
MAVIGFVFPGQGSQSVGMGLELAEQFESVRAYYEKADEVLEVSLSELIFQGPQEKLTLTANAQPALLTTSIAIMSRLQQFGIKPDYVAGHSLGEYSALVAGGMLDFEDAVRIVRKRGEFMEKAVPAGVGKMAAILGLDRRTLEDLTSSISADGYSVQLANINCPGQIVISGSAEGVTIACEKAKESGAKRAIMLDVSGPFHSSLMQPAAADLNEVLVQFLWKNAEVPVVSNVNAKPITSADEMKVKLLQQLYSPVLWQDCVEHMIELGVDTFIEIGSGKVLSGLIKKINRSVKVYSVSNEKEIQAVVAALKEE